MKKIIVFDLNDTLINSTETYKKIITELISEKYGIPLKRAKKIYSDSKEEIYKKKDVLTQTQFFKEFHISILRKLGKKITLENLKIFNELISKMDDIFPEKVKLHSNVYNSLIELKQMGYKLVILTGSKRHKRSNFQKKEIIKKINRLEKSLKNNNIHELIDKIFYTYKNKYLKPHRAAFMLPIKHFNVKECDAIFIGDREDDIKSNRFLFKSILFDRNGKYSDRKNVFCDFKDLPHIVKKIHTKS